MGQLLATSVTAALRVIAPTGITRSRLGASPAVSAFTRVFDALWPGSLGMTSPSSLTTRATTLRSKQRRLQP
jgi:hypothetical protein